MLHSLRASPCIRCVAGTVLVLCAALACGTGEEHPHPNVLLITLDTTRADHLGLYGYERETSPNLDELARSAVVHERAYATSSWTLPSHASLFTGRNPSSHGVRHSPDGELRLSSAMRLPEEVRARRLAPGEVTLARVLADAGWATGGVVAGPWMLELFGLSAGFQHWDDAGIRGTDGRPADEVAAALLAWIEDAPEPWFAFANFFDPHIPYYAPEPWRRAFLPAGVEPEPQSPVQFVDLYDGEILYMDAQLGRVFDALRRSGAWDRTLVVVTGDHGEMFGAHGKWGHEEYLWEGLTRVPLIVKAASSEPPAGREAAPVGVVDVMPLVLERAGLEVPPGAQGRVPPGGDRPLLAEVHPMRAGRDTGVWRAQWRGSLKYLESSLGARHLYDVERDPGEENDLLAGDPARAARAAERLEAAFDALPPPGEAADVSVDPATRDALRELGYLE